MSKIETVLLTNTNGMSVEVIDFGARISSIKFPVNGQITEMTVAYENVASYLDDSFYLGATCGRVCNRISNGKFDLNGKTYQLSQNDDKNCLHGGVDNFSYRHWEIDSKSSTQVTLSLTSADGDQGFPGTLHLSMQYQLTADNQLIISYNGSSDAATPINLTNHTYFNLGEASCESLLLQINASTYLERNTTSTPTGNIISVSQSDYDFRQPENIGARQSNSKNKELIDMQGYDHCFVLDSSPLASAKAELISLQNNVKMSLYTDQPAVQFYTGSYLSGEIKRYQGACLEAQDFPDAVNHAHFPNTILQPKQEYQRQITYKFETI